LTAANKFANALTLVLYSMRQTHGERERDRVRERERERASARDRHRERDSMRV